MRSHSPHKMNGLDLTKTMKNYNIYTSENGRAAEITLSNPYQIKEKYIPSPHLFQFQTRSLTFLFSHLPIRYCLHLMRYDNILIEIAIFCSKILYISASTRYILVKLKITHPQPSGTILIFLKPDCIFYCTKFGVWKSYCESRTIGHQSTCYRGIDSADEVTVPRGTKVVARFSKRCIYTCKNVCLFQLI